MVQSIGTSQASGAISSGTAAASLEAQLVRYQNQLSDCVNCDSSKTAEGKAEIQDISSKISEVRQRIDKVTGANSSGQTTQLATSTAAGNNTNNIVATAKNDATNSGSNVKSNSVYATVGSVVDVRA